MQHLLFTTLLLALLPVALHAQVPYAALLVPDDAQLNTGFGNAVAIDGDYALVGAFLDNNANGDKAGAVYVFKRDGASWTQHAKLTGSSTTSGDRMGISVALHGTLAVVGTASDNDQGAVYLFRREGETWTEEAILTVPDLPPDQRIGSHVVTNGDVVVTEAPATQQEAARVFTFIRENDVWSQQTVLLFENGEGFLLPIDLTEDHLAIGLSSSDDIAEDAGLVYVYEREDNTWVEEAQIVGSGVQAGDRFGVGVALNGTTLAVGTGGSGFSAGPQGAIYVFEQGGDVWTETTRLTVMDASSDRPFGGTPLVLSDTHLAAGRSRTRSENGEVINSVYTAPVFKREAGTWTHLIELTPAEDTYAVGFGTAVDLDGEYLIVGQDSHIIGDGVSSAYIYQLSDFQVSTERPALAPFALSPLYPNPTSGRVSFRLTLPQAQPVTVALYDVLGRHVQTVHDGFLATTQSFVLNTRPLPSGSYFLRVITQQGAFTRPLAVSH